MKRVQWSVFRSVMAVVAGLALGSGTALACTVYKCKMVYTCIEQGDYIACGWMRICYCEPVPAPLPR